MLAIQDSASLDPFRVTYTAVTDEPRMAALYDPLVYIDPKTGQVVPHLADSFTAGDGGRTWTLKLRPGIAFSDGTPFDAAAVKLNWETHAKPETRSVHVAYAAGLQMQATDPQTLRVTLPAANPNFDRTVATHLTYIEAPSAIGQGLEAAGRSPVGAGPFTLQSWTRGSAQVFAKNPNYWQRDKGLPKLDKLTVKTVPDVNQEYNTLKSGGADLIQASDPALLAKAAKELHAVAQPSSGGQMVMFNLTRAPFDDPRARRALALAIDPADLAKTLANGYVPAKNLFGEQSPFFEPAAAQPVPDHAEAQRLFDELAAEGKKVEFTYLVPKALNPKKVAEYMQSRLRGFDNVTMNIESLEISAYLTKGFGHRDYQAMLTQQWITDPEPDFFNTYRSTSPLNPTGWNNPQADAALAAGRAATDPAARKQAYGDLQKAMTADLPVWVYAASVAGTIHTGNVTGIEHYNTGVPLMDRLART